MGQIQASIQRVREKLAQLEEKYDRRPGSVRLLVVSKRRTVEEIRFATVAGVVDFGENYLQEAFGKCPFLEDLPLIWHFIGAIQSNKTRQIARHFSWAHSVDRLKIAERLDRECVGRPPLNVCLQVNISGEKSKSGIDPECLPELCAQVSSLPSLRLRGLMALPAPMQGFSAQCRSFMEARRLFEDLAPLSASRQFQHWDTLSMGTSNDLEAAVACGSTLVRIGTGIFGSRPV
ncbi:MAG: YggS family pyridoxal phosphate-dependent enzyme [Candidatus Eutrophobiaceae bacterium]